jgi:hypothetical protein
MRKLCLSAILTLSLTVSSFALQRQVNDAELSVQSDLIIHGSVTAVEFVQSEGDFHVLTRLTVDVDRQMKGARADQVQLLVPGGELGEFTVKVSDTPEFKLGDEAIFFLYEKPGYEVHWLYGWEQGALRVEDNQVVARGVSLETMCTRIETLNR